MCTSLDDFDDGDIIKNTMIIMMMIPITIVLSSGECM